MKHLQTILRTITPKDPSRRDHQVQVIGESGGGAVRASQLVESWYFPGPPIYSFPDFAGSFPVTEGPAGRTLIGP